MTLPSEPTFRRTMADGGCTETQVGADDVQIPAEIPEKKDAEPEEDIYEVEKIVGISTNKGQTLYRVRWVGYAADWDTWEPYENLSSCSEMIDKYVEQQKQEKETGKQVSEWEKDVFSRDSSGSECPSPAASRPVADLPKKKEKKLSYYYVEASDDEADTLKDKFWRNLEQGKVDVFSEDLYSRAKGSRSAKPQSFSDMFDGGRTTANTQAEEDGRTKAARKRRKKSRTSIDSQTSDGKGETDSVGSNESKTVKRKPGRPKGKRRDSKDSESSSASSRKESVESAGAVKSAVRRTSTGKKKQRRESMETTETVNVQTEVVPMQESVERDTEAFVPVKKQEEEECTYEGAETLEDPVELVLYPACDSPTSQSSTNSEGTSTQWDGNHGDQETGQRFLSEPTGESVEEQTAAILPPCRVVLKRLSHGRQPGEATSDPCADATVSTEMSPGETMPTADVVPESEIANVDVESQHVACGPGNPANGGPILGSDAQMAISPPVELPTVYNPVHYDVSADVEGAGSLQSGSSDVGGVGVGEKDSDLLAAGNTGDTLLDRISQLAKNYPLKSDMADLLNPLPAPSEESDQLSKRRKLQEPCSVPPVLAGDQRLKFVAEQSLSHPVQSESLAPCVSGDPRRTQDPSEKPTKKTITLAEAMRRPRWGSSSIEQQTPQDQPLSWPEEVMNTQHSVPAHCVKAKKPPGDPRAENRGDVMHVGQVNNNDSECLGIDLAEISQDWQSKKIERKLSVDPLELSNEDLRQAVKENNYRLVCRAFKTSRQYDLEQPDHLGNTLAMLAAQHGFDDMLELLVMRGAQLNTENKAGATSLTLAAEQGLRCTVELLVLMGSNMNGHQHSTETPLMKAVKRGHKSVVRVLLDYGANFSSPNNGDTPIKLAKHYNHRDIVDIINTHISRVTAEFENQVLLTLNNTANIICALFPMQCFTLRDADKFRVTFKHELQPAMPGVGVLLFIAHARITPHEARCRFYGPCAVTAALLNGVQLKSLTEEGQFVLSFTPMQPGKNELEIYTVKQPSSRAKLVVCAYRAQLMGR